MKNINIFIVLIMRFKREGLLFKGLVFAFFATAFSMPVAACSPIKVIDIYFEKNSSKITDEQHDRLAAWVARLRQVYAELDYMGTEINVEIGEDQPQQLGRNRELALRLALIDLDFMAPTFYSAESIRVIPPQPTRADGGSESRSVGVELLPGCPHECPCQMGWKPRAK